MLGVSVQALHKRLSRGWMRGHTIRDGRRILVNRAALLADLDGRRRR
jgi:hypothetical protein